MFILAITPGPGVFATVARALASGFWHSSVVVLGIVTGDLVFLLLAMYGLSAIAEYLSGFFLVVKYLGAGYLIYLGIHLWRVRPEILKIKEIEELSWKSNFLSGLFITLGNPKVILFYLGFLPTFIELSTLSNWDAIAIATVVAIVLGSTMLGYAFLADRSRTLFQNHGGQTIMNRIAGSVAIATGTVLAVKA